MVKTFPYQKAKKFRFANEYFCHFKFCHNKGNHFKALQCHFTCLDSMTMFYPPTYTYSSESQRTSYPIMYYIL